MLAVAILLVIYRCYEVIDLVWDVHISTHFVSPVAFIGSASPHLAHSASGQGLRAFGSRI